MIRAKFPYARHGHSGPADFHREPRRRRRLCGPLKNREECRTETATAAPRTQNARPEQTPPDRGCGMLPRPLLRRLLFWLVT